MQRARQKVWSRNADRKSKYGLSPTDYEKMFESQKGRCKICDTHRSKLNRELAVDHCHLTGAIRSLLCTKCNTAIGQLNDSELLCHKAGAYLKEHLTNNQTFAIIKV